MTQTGESSQLAARPGDDATVADLGEFALIDRLARLLHTEGDPFRPPVEGEIAIGDDAAAWRPTPGRWEILTTDALVEDVHFRRGTTSWHDLGWKALAENVSDVAAMGARPRRAFVTLGLPGRTRVADLEALYRGMREAAGQFELAIVGGDTVAAPVIFISISVVGEVDGLGLRRAAGRVGDVLAVTGALGGSAGGLELLEGGISTPGSADEHVLIERHRRPSPRVREGLLLAESGVRCGMDLSDGLLGDAAKLAAASGIGIRIFEHRLPVEPALDRRFSERARQLALAGGEDYELLVAAPGDVIDRARAALDAQALAPLTAIGELTAGPAGRVQVVDAQGRPVAAEHGSWDHFGGPAPETEGSRKPCSG